MGATAVRIRSVLGLPLLMLITAACALVCAGLVALPAAAFAAPAVHVDLTQNMQAINGYGFTASASATVDVFASPPPGGTQVWHYVTATHSGGAFSIGPQVHGLTFAPGMHVRVRDDTTMAVKDLTLAPLTFDALSWDDDTATGTALPGATVQVSISSAGLPNQDQVTATADLSGVWTADFGTPHGDPLHTYDVLYGMFANAHVQDADQDATTMGSPPAPFIAGEMEGRIWGGEWADNSSVSVQVDNGGTEVYSGTAPTDGNGFFVIEHDAIGSGFDAGMIITVSDANYTKELTLADLTFAPLDSETDTAVGSAPAGASVNVSVWNGEESDELTVTANGSGVWTAGFGAPHGTPPASYDIRWNTDGEARLTEDGGAGGDGDSTIVHPQTRPWIYAGQRAGIGGGGFAPNASVDVEVTDTDGVTTLFSDTVPTDANGGFDVQEGTLGFEFAADMVVEVRDGTWTKELTLVPLTFDLIDPVGNTATGTGPAGAVVGVDVNDDSGGASKEVTLQGDGTWTANFSPFDVTGGMNGGVAHYDEDGDSTRAEWYPPRIQALYSPYGWDNCSGNDFTANTQLDVSLRASASPGAQLLFAAMPLTDGEGSFQVDLGSVDLAPGMKLVVTDPSSLLIKSLILEDLWVDVLDPGHNTVSGTAPAGRGVWLCMSGGAGDDLGQWEATANGSGVWSVNCAPADLDWASWGEVGVRDADGNETRTEAIPRRIACNLVGDTIDGVAFSRNSTVTASVLAVGSSTPLWSGPVSTDADGLVSVTRSTHGLDLTAGMRVRIDDESVPGIIKQVTLSPLTYDELDAVTDTARGTGQPGSSVTIGGMTPGGGGEWAYVTPDAGGQWSVDMAALGWEIPLNVTSDATVYDPELDATSAPFVPHVLTLQSSTHPISGVWYASHDPAFSWTPSPSAMDYSWTLDQSPATIPDETVDGSGTSCAFTGKADGIWYFHVRVHGGPGMYQGGGYWGATSHLLVRIDGTAPTVTDNADSVWHGSAVTVALSPADGASGVQKTQYRLQGSGTWLETAGDQFTVPAPAGGSNDGAHVYEYRALDNAGNVSGTGSCTVRIDTTSPAIAALSCATHGDGSAWSTNNDPIFEWAVGADAAKIAGNSWAVGAGAAEIAGYSWALDQSATTTPDETVDGTASRASFTDVADGIWYVHVRAQDAAGNWGAAQHASVRIDTARPTLRAYAAGVVRGRRVSVGYRLDDPVSGCCSGSVKIVIRNARGKVMKTRTIAGVPANVKKFWKFTCRFPAGRYTIRITGSDLAGNTCARAATAVLRVR